jgi:hypothetical protein
MLLQLCYVFLSKAGLSLEKLFGPSSAISIALSTRRQGQGEFADDPEESEAMRGVFWLTTDDSKGLPKKIGMAFQDGMIFLMVQHVLAIKHSSFIKFPTFLPIGGWLYLAGASTVWPARHLQICTSGNRPRK